MTPELLPCPFCGHLQTGFIDGAKCTFSSRFKCLSCGAEGPTSDDSEHCAILWNMRAADRLNQALRVMVFAFGGLSATYSGPHALDQAHACARALAQARAALSP